MFAAKRPLFSLAFLVLLAGSLPAFSATRARSINIPDTGVVDDDDKPAVTDRVARVSFIDGTAKVRRADSRDWEAVTLNLPIVEGDEIATENGAKVEIQFAKNQHVRLAEESSLRIVTLRDDGIALSLSAGTLVTHVDSFDKGKFFFEIDAPKTTVAIEKAGTFRVDAGKSEGEDVRVAATEGGEARVYSDTSGFTLKNGRSTRIAIAGTNAGEWQTSNADDHRDAFDAWATSRDLVVAQRIKQAYYDKYYDDDIYGADDLDGYGQWVNTSKYGWVWRPDRSAVSMYADWSPYRYGHWRWMPPFGWVWVNDEPWGWATYHHGRWVYDAGYWYWSPYGYYRTSRSWWFPALVAINIIDVNITWYPIGYNDRCRWDYWGHNRGHGGRGDGGRGGHGGGNGGGPPQPGPVAGGHDPGRGGRPDGIRNPPIRGGGRNIPPGDVPPGAVVATTADEFVAGGHGGRLLPPDVVEAVLERREVSPALNATTAQLSERTVTRYRTTPPSRQTSNVREVEVGASTRVAGAPLDDNLEKEQIFRGRAPKVMPQQTASPDGGSPAGQPRSTGAVEREWRPRGVRETAPPVTGDTTQPDTGRGTIRPMPPVGTGGTSNDDPGRKPPREYRPKPRVEPRAEPPVEAAPPVDSTPRREPRPQPREEPRPRTEPPPQPRNDPPPRSEPREQPRPQPPPRQEPTRPETRVVERKKDKDDG